MLANVVISLSLMLPVANWQETPAANLSAAIDAYREAIVRGDRAALDALLHADFQITGGDGQTRNKAGELADLVGDGFTVHEFRLDEGRVREYGGTGVASGILRWRMTYQGRESAIE